MSNMSDCRFQNTCDDMAECLEALRNEEDLSADECLAAEKMFVHVLEYLRENDVIEDYDRKALRELLDGRVREEA